MLEALRSLCRLHGIGQFRAHPQDAALPQPRQQATATARQWALAVPKRLRYSVERGADLRGAGPRLFLRISVDAFFGRCIGTLLHRPSNALRRRAVGGKATILPTTWGGQIGGNGVIDRAGGSAAR